jgi:hypothetical protein
MPARRRGRIFPRAGPVCQSLFVALSTNTFVNPAEILPGPTAAFPFLSLFKLVLAEFGKSSKSPLPSRLAIGRDPRAKVGLTHPNSRSSAGFLTSQAPSHAVHFPK